MTGALFQMIDRFPEQEESDIKQGEPDHKIDEQRYVFSIAQPEQAHEAEPADENES